MVMDDRDKKKYSEKTLLAPVHDPKLVSPLPLLLCLSRRTFLFDYICCCLFLSKVSPLSQGLKLSTLLLPPRAGLQVCSAYLGQ